MNLYGFSQTELPPQELTVKSEESECRKSMRNSSQRKELQQTIETFIAIASCICIGLPNSNALLKQFGNK